MKAAPGVPVHVFWHDAVMEMFGEVTTDAQQTAPGTHTAELVHESDEPMVQAPRATQVPPVCDRQQSCVAASQEVRPH